MDYRFQSIYERLRNLESGLSLFDTYYNYDTNGNIESVEYTNGDSEDIVIEYIYDSNGDVTEATYTVDLTLEYTQTFNYNSNGDITSTTVAAG